LGLSFIFFGMGHHFQARPVAQICLATALAIATKCAARTVF